MKLWFFRQDVPKRALLVVLVLAAVAGVVMGREKPAIEVARERPVEAPRPLQADIDLDKLARTEGALPQNDPFAQRSFAREHAGAPAAARAAAPPLPFRYIGKVIENGKTEIYLARGDELVSAAPGGKLGAEYRVDKVGEKSITFTYLPLKMKQTLDLPEMNR